jgi:hypothetical protein
MSNIATIDPAALAYLEELEDLRRPANLRFIGDNGGIISFHARVSGLETNSTEPFLLADGTIRIPLDRLLSIDGVSARGAA